MPKLVKQKYFTAKGEQKINCYKITISKETVKKAGITDEENLKAKAENGKIIIEREK